jgi:hypothetical protein
LADVSEVLTTYIISVIIALMMDSTSDHQCMVLKFCIALKKMQLLR